MTDTDRQADERRRVVRNPLVDDENAGVIVAPGDPLPAAVGYVGNTPNKVDAAANYDEVDAADKAKNARPATTVVTEGTGPDQEIVDRVAENRQRWVQSENELAAQAASPDERSGSSSSSSDTPKRGRSGGRSSRARASTSASSSGSSAGGDASPAADGEE